MKISIFRLFAVIFFIFFTASLSYAQEYTIAYNVHISDTISAKEYGYRAGASKL